jgi:hypothetical protein
MKNRTNLRTAKVLSKGTFTVHTGDSSYDSDPTGVWGSKLAGWDLDPRWADDDHEEIVLSVPAWAVS